jgi:hypothetical protein
MPKRITRKQLADSVYLVLFETQYELAATFLRVQEHYESKRFHGHVFSLEQYMDWYAGQYGNFTYYEDWSGFNVPSSALQPFYRGEFDPLLEKEKRLLQLFEREQEPYYVIGLTKGGSKGDLTHELAHALFFTDMAYREAAVAAIRQYDTSALRRELTQLGYAKHVLQDEVHAYLVAPSGDLGKPSRALVALRKTLRALYQKHSAGLSSAALSPASRQTFPTRSR